LTRLFTILPLLLCPLLMLACMWAMGGMGNRKVSQGHAGADHEELPTGTRIAELEHELADLRSRLPNAEPTGQNMLPSQPERRGEVRPTAPAEQD
jgi:hypothetical protein